MKVTTVVLMVMLVGCLLPISHALRNALERRPWTASRVRLRRRVALRQALLTTLQEHRQRLRQSSLGLQESKFQGSYSNVTSGGPSDVTGSGVRGRRDAPAVMYVPVGGGEGGVRCPDAVDAAAVSVSQLVFLSLSLGIFTAITNIATNINNNNNNNNDNSDNNINSNNLNVGANGNAGNQITVQIPFKRSLRTIRSLWAPYSHTPTHITTQHSPPLKHPTKPPILPATPSFSEGVAASWVLRALKEWAWDVQPLSPPCLGRRLCRLLSGTQQKPMWTHGLAGYYLLAGLEGRLSLPLADYLKEALKGNCDALFPGCTKQRTH